MVQDLSSFTCVEMAICVSTDLNSSYKAMNSSTYQTGTSSEGFEYDIKILKMYNDSDVGVTISYDGIINHDYLPSKGTMIIDLQTNHADNAAYGAGTLNGRQGQLVYGKQTGATTGNIYISGYR